MAGRVWFKEEECLPWVTAHCPQCGKTMQILGRKKRTGKIDCLNCNTTWEYKTRLDKERFVFVKFRPLREVRV